MHEKEFEAVYETYIVLLNTTISVLNKANIPMMLLELLTRIEPIIVLQ